MVIDVPESRSDAGEGLSAVSRHLHPGFQGVDAINVGGVGYKFVVVLRRSGDVIRLFFPALTAVCRAEEASIFVRRLDDGIQDIGVGG